MAANSDYLVSIASEAKPAIAEVGGFNVLLSYVLKVSFFNTWN